MENKSGIKIKITTIVLSFLLIMVALFAGVKTIQVNFLRKELQNQTNKQVATIDVNNGQIPYEETYAFDITDMQNNETKEYKINDDYTVKFNVKTNKTKLEDENMDVYFGIYVNGNLITMDNLIEKNKYVDIVIWNGYLMYSVNGGTDIRSDITYVIGKDGQVVRMIYELDENDKGLVQESIWRYSDKLVVTGTRLSHGYSVVSHGNPSDGITVKSLKTIPKDTVVKAIYTYKINENGIIDFEKPEITILETFEQYVKEYKDNIISAIKTESEYEDGMVDKYINEN